MASDAIFKLKISRVKSILRLFRFVHNTHADSAAVLLFRQTILESVIAFYGTAVFVSNEIAVSLSTATILG